MRRLEPPQPARQRASEVSESSFASVCNVQTFTGVTDVGAFVFEGQKPQTSFMFLFTPNLASIKKHQKAQLVLMARVVRG